MASSLDAALCADDTSQCHLAASTGISTKQARTVLAYSMPLVMDYLPLLAVRQEALCMCPTASLSLGLGTRTPGSTFGRYEAH